MARTSISFASGYYSNVSTQAYAHHSHIGDSGNNKSVDAANTQAYIGIAGTFKKLTVAVVTENGATGRIVKIWKNNAAGVQSISIGNGLTGLFSDISNTDSFAVGDLLDFGVITSNTSTWAFSDISVEFEHSTNCINFLTGYFNSTNNATSVRYSTLAGYQSQVSTEADVEQYIDVACTLNRLSVMLSTNSRNTTLAVAVRKNNVDTAMTTSIAAGTTGRFTNPSSTATFAVGDIASIGWTPVAGTGSHGVSYTTVTADYGAVDEFLLLNASHTSTTWGSGPATRKWRPGTYLPTGSILNSSTWAYPISAYTFSKSRLHVLTNATTGASTFDWRKNDVASGTIAVSVPSGTTGHFTTTGSFEIAASQGIGTSIVTTTSGAMTCRTWGAVMAQVTAQPSVNVVMMS